MVPIERLTNSTLPEGTILQISNSNIWARQIFGVDIQDGDEVSVVSMRGEEVVVFEILRNGQQVPIGISEDCFEPFDNIDQLD